MNELIFSTNMISIQFTWLGSIDFLLETALLVVRLLLICGAMKPGTRTFNSLDTFGVSILKEIKIISF